MSSGSSERVSALDHRLNNSYCLARIFSYLNLPDRRSVELTSKYWREISINDVPLKPSTVEIVYLNTGTVRITFCDFVWLVPVQDADGHSSCGNIDGAMNGLLERIFSTYGCAISKMHYGGDGGVFNPCDDLPSTTLPVGTNFLRSVFEMPLINLTSISLRSVSINGEAWRRLAECVHILRTEGNLKTLCLHSISTKDDAENIEPLGPAVVQLQQLGLSSVPYAVTTGLGEAAAVMKDNDNGAILDELFVVMHQAYFVTYNAAHMAYILALRAARNVDLRLFVREFWDLGVEASLTEIFHVVGHRLRCLDLRLFWTERRAPPGAADPSPISVILHQLDPVVDSLRQLSLFGNEMTFTNDSFAAFVGCISLAPELRRLSLGKVCGKRMTNFLPLGALTQLEWLHISSAPHLDRSQLSEILNQLPCLKRLWLFDIRYVTEKAVLPFVDRLEAVEISKCQSFKPKSFFESLLHKLQKSEIAADHLVSSLEFVKVNGCSSFDLKYLKWATRGFAKYGAWLSVDWRKHCVTLVLKNRDKWRDVSSIRLPWYNCEYCGAETSD